MSEKDLHKQICDYLKLQYPKVIFNTDMAGIKLTIGQAKQAKQLRSSNSFPDICIFEPKIYGSGEIETSDNQKHKINVFHFCGLFLELKKENPYLKDGTTLKKMIRQETIKGSLVKYDHLERQNEMLLSLNKRGYVAVFAWSFDMAKTIIDNYLTL